ncbi:MAG: putative replicase protein [Alehxovirus pseudonemorisvicinum]|uniref:RNA-directed RNA polymerase n=1 Tax=Leviviridae sp. TaxID=2027243 RepID=A0ABY3SUD6_9VIRU|nr:MAG: putative replicase protein [Leviviridae sp.]
MNDTKSYVHWFLGLYRSILKDIEMSIPSLRVDCERDYKRLLSAVDSHGIPFIMDTMVSFAKHLDRCLADGRLTPTGLCHFGPYRRGVAVPRLFKGLLLRVFYADGELRPDPDVGSIRFLRQLLLCLKNFTISCPNSRIYESVQEFIRTDDEVRLPSLSWDDVCLNSSSAYDLQFGDLVLPELPLFPGQNLGGEGIPSIGRETLSAVQLTADIVTSFLGRFDPLEWRTRHGPGAVSDLRGNSINKYDFPSWNDRLETVFPFADFAFANYGDWAHSLQHEDWFNECKTSTEPTSRLIAVPKTYRAPRLIASEPCAHQWCQQSVRDYLMSRIADTPISPAITFRDQSVNGRAAAGASHSGSHATIDLSSASDRISCWVIERLFRRSTTLLSALHSCRTRWITQDLDKRCPDRKRLRKFSTMGSAVTFPVQTILFSVIAVGATLNKRGIRPTIRSIRKVSQEVQVFGDDIIVPIDSWELTRDILTAFGLKVNVDKTFGTGKFRESCGTDAYDGHTVSKVSVLRMPAVTKPESVLSAVDSHNNLFINGYFEAASYIKKTVEAVGRYVFPSVASDSGLLGWWSFGIPDNSHLKTRWNARLCRTEYRCTRPSARTSRIPTGRASLMLQYYTETRPGSLVIGDRLGIAAMRTPLRMKLAWDPLWG